jgi:hypothetical protein
MIYDKGNRSVPPSNAMGTPKIENPRLTIFADDPMLLVTRITAKSAVIASRYLKGDDFINDDSGDVFMIVSFIEGIMKQRPW